MCTNFNADLTPFPDRLGVHIQLLTILNQLAEYQHAGEATWEELHGPNPKMDSCPSASKAKFHIQKPIPIASPSFPWYV